MTRAIDDVLRDGIAKGLVPGVVAMAGGREGTSYQGAFGFRDTVAGRSMELNTVFWLASMTKAITSAAAMQQVERGALDLDAPVGRILPELAAPQVLEGFDAGGEPRLRPAKRAITLRHLLTHTAGFGYDIWNEGLGRYRALKGIPGVGSRRNLALSLPLLFDPGDAWEYGIGIDWAGKAVEAVTGERLGKTLERTLFTPLGMRDTGFGLRPDQETRLTAMHERRADGRWTSRALEQPRQPEFDMGGGGLFGTAGDYLRFTQMILGEGALGGVRVLARETVRMMLENGIGALLVRRLKSALPAVAHDLAFFPESVHKWTLGFMRNEEPLPGGRSTGSVSWAGLGNTYYWIDPARGITGLLLTQFAPFAAPSVIELYGAFERAVYRELR
ncbi:MAG TPA: serine hydrolase domain-containing protein [Stellaceae bacterium]|nr:serine hydrolase domain-containing protein [Stellaceae bacterium]